MPVTLLLKNWSWNKTVKYNLDLLPAQNLTGCVFLCKLMKRTEFPWVGMTSLQGELEPQSECQLTVYASFVSPYVYDLSRWRLTAGDFTVSPTSRCLVVIESA
jgi:hypothetical protein